LGQAALEIKQQEQTSIYNGALWYSRLESGNFHAAGAAFQRKDLSDCENPEWLVLKISFAFFRSRG
jgi:hypothetical protein